MKIGRIAGNIVCTVKSQGLERCPLLIVKMLDFQLKETGEKIIAIDRIGVGTGETVILSLGRECSLGMKQSYVSADASVVGIYQGGQYKP